MWPVSDAFTAAIKKSHQRVIRVDIHDTDGTVVASTDPADSTVARVDATGGSVTITRTGEYRRSAEVTLVDRSKRHVVTAGSLFDPLVAREFRLYRGLRLPDRTVELVPLGVFVLDSTQIDEKPDGGVTIKISGKDRMTYLAGAEWRETWRLEPDLDPSEAIAAIIAEYGRLGTTNFVSTDHRTTRQTFGADSSTSPLKAVHAIAQASGLTVFFDQVGVLTTRQVLDPATIPIVWRLERNGESLRVPNATRSMAGSTARNGVVVTSNAPWLLFPVRGEVWDTDPSSPGYYDPDETDPGLIARMARPNPERVVTSMVGSNAQAEAMAASLFAEHVGIEETIQFTMVPHPALDVEDGITVESDIWGGGANTVVVDRLTMPLAETGASQVTARRRRR